MSSLPPFLRPLYQNLNILVVISETFCPCPSYWTVRTPHDLCNIVSNINRLNVNKIMSHLSTFNSDCPQQPLWKINNIVFQLYESYDYIFFYWSTGILSCQCPHAYSVPVRGHLAVLVDEYFWIMSCCACRWTNEHYLEVLWTLSRSLLQHFPRGITPSRAWRQTHLFVHYS